MGAQQLVKMLPPVGEWPNLEVPDRVVFERTPLILALCQVRFAPVLSVSNPVAVAPFQNAIISDYPMMQQIQGQNLSLKIEGAANLNQASLHSSAGPTEWRFSDVDDTWTVVLTQEFVTLETRAYSEFSEFEDRLERVLGALDKTIHPQVVLRIGLRYVNEIRIKDADWKDAIQPKLLGALGVPELQDTAVQSFQQIQFKSDEGIGATIQHGLLPTGTTVNPRENAPSDGEGAFYLLDFDVFQEFKPGTMSLKPRPIRDCVRRYHDILSALFRWSVTEAYTTTLGRVAHGHR